LSIRSQNRTSRAAPRPLALLLGLAWSAGVTAAPAAESPTDRMVARSLFDQGRELMAAGRAAEACPKFAESQRLAPGGGTLLNLALCHKQIGKTATAWLELKDALAAARRDQRADREKVAQENLDALQPALCWLTVTAGKAGASPPSEVTLDGTVIGPAAWGAAMPVDPGEHVVAARAAGKKTWTGRVTLAASERKSIAVPALDDEAAAAAPLGATPAPAAAPASRAAPQSTAEPAAGDRAPSSRRTLAYVSGGVGIASLAVGAYFGLRASSKWSEAKNDHCPAGACDAQALALRDDAMTAAWVSNVGFGLGLIGVGVGTYLLVTSPGEKPPSAQARGATVRAAPVVSAGSGGLSLSGAW
jgi:hypothetical protein